MVWFYCDGCCDTIKKPKLVSHFRMCGGHAFTCVDCSRTFDRQSAQGHSTCVSEHEKYALGATKPGGYAAKGFYTEGGQVPAAAPAAAAAGEQEVIGLQFLSERAPWKCSCCNVNCTSRDTLLGHATGVKHKRRARAALGLTNNQQQQQQQQADDAAAVDAADANKPAADTAADTKQDSATAAAAAAADGEEQPASKKQKKEKKDKKRKQESEQDEPQQQQAVEEKDSKQEKKEKTSKNNGEPTAEPAAAEKQQQQETKKKKYKRDKAADAAAEQPQQQQEASKKDKKKDKKSKKQQQQPDPAVLEPLLKVAKKKLKKKGSLGLSKLQSLLQENANGSFSAELVEAVQQQLLASGEVQLKASKLHWQAAAN